jgi:hypothetical protein
MSGATEKWDRLLPYLDSERPPVNMDLYEEPTKNAVAVVERGVVPKSAEALNYLLVGPRGGGKSTALRQLSRRLKDIFTIGEVDLDIQGIASEAVGAHDLLYLASLALLRKLPKAEREPLVKDLAEAYTGGDAQTLGDLNAAVEGVLSFGEAAKGLAVAAGIATGHAPLLLAGGAVARASLRLFGDHQNVVGETSARGSQLQLAVQKIADRVRHQTGRRILVLVDGLERMNGTSAERFRAVFESTRLLLNAPWLAVFASPPCLLTETTAASQIGYLTVPVWGFPQPDSPRLTELLTRRFRVAGLEAQDCVNADDLNRLSIESGGQPRSAVRMLYQAVTMARQAVSERISTEQMAASIQEEAERLMQGVGDQSLLVLERVFKSGTFPEGMERAAELFSDGRILALPPAGGSLLRWRVHPLLEPAIRQYLEKPSPEGQR